MQCPICFEDIISNYIKFSKCKHKFCDCIYKNNTLQVTSCPLCRSEDLTFIRGKQMKFRQYERRCLTCNIRVSNVFSKCIKCSKDTEWVPFDMIHWVEILEVCDISIIVFLVDPPNCMCCYRGFAKRICLLEGEIYHMFPKFYIQTDLECWFDERFTLKKCDWLTVIS